MRAFVVAASAPFACALACNGAPPQPQAPPRAPASVSASAPPPPRDPNAPVEIAAGDDFWCGRANGRVRCHGRNDRGQLGGAQMKRGDADVIGVANAEAIAAYGDNACARLADGTAKCWGGRDHGKPVDVEAFAGATALVSTLAGVCARVGANARCRSDDAFADAPIAAPVIADAIQTETMRVDGSDGSTHTTSCALRPDGTVLCWGANDLGQIGDGTTKDREKPTRVSGITDAAEIRLEWGRACARLRDGTVKCWGDNDRGLLVPNAAQPVLRTPVAVKGIANAAHIAVGAEHACAALKDGTLRCWGDADDMPNGWEAAVKDAPQPVAIPDVAHVAGVVARGVDTCVWRDDGRVHCWQKQGKETGLDATWDDDNVVPWIDDAIDVALSVNEWCARTKSGRTKCWGDRWYGEPAPVPKLDRVVEIADGQLHACARVEGGAVKCWGWNVEGSLGAPGRGLFDEPVEVAGLGAVTRVAVGAMHSVAIADGAVRAWKPTFGKSEPAITTIDGVRGATAIAAGAHHACAIAGGAVTCWGESSRGQLGSDAKDRAIVPGVSDAIAITAANDLTCALRRGGAVVCWGTMSPKDAPKDRAPTQIAGVADAVQVAVGAGVAYVLRKDGAVLAVDANRAAKPVDPS